jgi:ribosomal protein S27AE
MKVCKGCERSFPLTGFYAHPETKDGRLNFCKECVKQRMRNQRADGDHVLKLQRQRQRYTYDRERMKRYRPRAAGRAHARVAYAIKKGTLVRPSECEQCGSSEYGIEAAHSDYTRPLDIRWLCRRCHRRWDGQESKVARLNRTDAF